MSSPHDAIRDHIFQQLCIPDPSKNHIGSLSKPVGAMSDLTVLRDTEWNPEFEMFMRNRLLMGAFRYGTFADKAKVRFDCTGYAKKKIDLYLETGNLECLVDAANMCLLEFTFPQKESVKWEPEDNKISCKITKYAQKNLFTPP